MENENGFGLNGLAVNKTLNCYVERENKIMGGWNKTSLIKGEKMPLLYRSCYRMLFTESSYISNVTFYLVTKFPDIFFSNKGVKR